jgi:hypothetical protein
MKKTTTKKDLPPSDDKEFWGEDAEVNVIDMSKQPLHQDLVFTIDIGKREAYSEEAGIGFRFRVDQVAINKEKGVLVDLVNNKEYSIGQII